MAVKEIPVDEIGLSIRSVNALRRAGVHTVGALLQLTEEELFLIRNLGQKSVDEIREKIREYTVLEIIEPPAAAVPPEPEALPEKEPQSTVSDSIKGMPITMIGLSVRSVNALRRAGIHTVGTLLRLTEGELFDISNLGRKSVDEILQKIEEYSRQADQEPAETAPDREEEEMIRGWLAERDVPVTVLTQLSAKAYNVLEMNGCTRLEQIALLSEGELMTLRWMNRSLAEEIRWQCRWYLREHVEPAVSDGTAAEPPTLKTLLRMEKYRETIRSYAKAHDCPVEDMALSVRPLRLLLENGYLTLGDLIFVDQYTLLKIPQMGAASAQEILALRDSWLTEHESELLAVCRGEKAAQMEDGYLRTVILRLYQELGFAGLSLAEMTERLEPLLPLPVEQEQLKRVLGGLLAAGELEYCDFRCFRVYPGVLEWLETSEAVDDRQKDILRRRLQGETLSKIGRDISLARERVRQLEQKAIHALCGECRRKHSFFDEDYYRYFYETYAFDKRDIAPWLGIPKETFQYFILTDTKQGERELEAAPDDPKLEVSLKLKIRNYLNRNRLYVDGVWIEKSRSALEEHIVETRCREDVTFTEFVRLYNEFLEENEIPFDEKLYYTEDVLAGRRNRLMDARFLLWKQNERFRYYDIDGRDYDELLDTLNLEAYENTELSTLKWVRDCPELMEKYDIRDRYELHNLLRKIVPEGSFHDFHCSRMPTVRFGAFDREAALLEMLFEFAPISQEEFADRIQQEYGYDRSTILYTYLPPLAPYYHQGVYSVEQKIMPEENKARLLAALSDDFYYLDEIRRRYTELIPGADPEEINPFNLKSMGFAVFSRYALRNYSTQEAYFTHLLTAEEFTDITELRRRFVYVQSFSATLKELERSLQVVEFEPNQLLRFDRLERAGVSRADIHAFCDSVFEETEEGRYFSVQSLRQSGFEAELFELGFSDWFYAGLLAADPRFSSGRIFGAIILYKGRENVMVRSFGAALIREHGSIDAYDLMTELTETYGCRIKYHSDIIGKVQGEGIYYDKYLDRFYADRRLYEREIEETEATLL
ncbi:MAG: hypothetical protein IKD79_01160 [Oscillospiraceae bacterium]|nr:hypothetical protein [Oscillospiraceae bacterium]